jgi:hypothetical protein
VDGCSVAGVWFEAWRRAGWLGCAGSGHTGSVNSPLGQDSAPDDSYDGLTRRVGDWIAEQVFQVQLEDVAVEDLAGEMPAEPRRFRDLSPPYQGVPPWLLLLVQSEIGGGRATETDLAAIDDRPDALALRVSGLDQATFETLITRYGTQFLAIDFFKCPRITDLSPLEDLPGLRLVEFFWNQRATRLWDLSRNPCLTGLRFEDFTRLHDLGDLRAGGSLQELEFGDAVWSTSVFESLEPLTALGGLRSLSFNAKRIEDGRIEPVGGLTGLEELSIPTNMFTTRQLAWLRARLPDSVRSRSLAPVELLKDPFEDGRGKVKDVLLIGKRQPFLNSVTDEARIRKHVDGFWQMVDAFRRDPA